MNGDSSSLTGGSCSVKADPALQYASFTYCFPRCNMHRSEPEFPVLRGVKSLTPREGSGGRESYSPHILCS